MCMSMAHNPREHECLDGRMTRLCDRHTSLCERLPVMLFNIGKAFKSQVLVGSPAFLGLIH